MNVLVSDGIISAATPHNKRTWMINADHMPTAHETDGLILDELMHDTITSACAYSESARLTGT